MSQNLAVVADSDYYQQQASNLAEALGLPFVGISPPSALTEPAQVIAVGERIALCATGRKAPGPVFVDFVGGALAHRRRFGGGKSQQIAKAVGIRGGFLPRVFDGTAGLGRDAFVLASLGCEVQMLERNPVVRVLLQDGLRRLRAAAADDSELAAISVKLSLLEEQVTSEDWLRGQAEASVPVVYLDPMFPSREKTAKVKKEMVAFHHLVGTDDDADRLLEPALTACYYRTVVKRPRQAPFLAGRKPSLSLEGKSGRFDIYTKHGVPG